MEEQELSEKRLGTTLRNKWTLERLLGVGGMAAVYVGLHKIGRRDAIKILHPDVARSNDMRARFEQEAYAVNQLGHPGVVEIRDIDTTEDGAPFLVMELLDGEPLSDRAQRLGGIATDEILKIVDELCDVLAAAHARGIIHRDIKLDNLFVLRDGRLKVLDFGIAHMKSGAMVGLKTRFGTKLGTAPYMPPEQVKGMPIDGRADLFAVGATMFRLIAKRRIHEATTEPEMLILMATTPAPPLGEVAPEVPRGLALIVDRALAFNREQRYPDAGTMQRDVQAVRRGQPPPYATARLQAGDVPNPRLSDSGVASSGGAGAGQFADMPTVVPSRSLGAPPSVPRPSAPDFAPLSARAPVSTNAPLSSRAPVSTNAPLSSRAPVSTNASSPMSAPAPPSSSMSAPAPPSSSMSAPAPPSSSMSAPAPAVPPAPPSPSPHGLPPAGARTIRMDALALPVASPLPAPAAPPLALRSISRRTLFMAICALLVLVVAGVVIGWMLWDSAMNPPASDPGPSALSK